MLYPFEKMLNDIEYGIKLNDNFFKQEQSLRNTFNFFALSPRYWDIEWPSSESIINHQSEVSFF